MVEQLLIAYCIGMVVAIALEGRRIMKARRMNRAAALRDPVASAGAPTWRNVQAVSHDATAKTPANESSVMKATG